MANIPLVKIPRDFYTAVVSYDSTYDEGGVECLLVNQVGFPHANIIDLHDLPKNSEKKFDLVIYIHRSRKDRKISDFLRVLYRYKEKFIGVPSLKVNIMECDNRGFLKVRNVSRDNKIFDIIEAVSGHLGKMYNISFQR